MGKFRELGEKWTTWFIHRSYWQQDIKKCEYVKMILKVIIIVTGTAWIYYRSWVAVILLIPAGVWYYIQLLDECIKRKEQEFLVQFKELIQTFSSLLNTGYSVENAVSACVRDLEQLYPKNEDIVAEFRYIETQQRVSVPVEELFLDLGQRCKVEDIENFASVLYTAKRSGGDLGNVIQKVARMLGDKIDVKKEIEATLAAKKSEQMIMSLMPAGIILYLQLASPGFLDILYGNPFGICAMTVCLAVYGAAYWMGKRIVEIEV